jgi:23S rRNA pseudouridine1911/1915/1917 synthase
MPRQLLPVAPADHHKPLGPFLAEKLGFSKRQAKRLLDDRVVFVNHRRTWMAQHQLQRGDRVEVLAGGTAAPAGPRILYEDAQYLVVDKPPGRLSTGPRSLEQFLREQRGQPGITAVHRLDRDTSGCNLFALQPAWRDRAIPLFERRQVTKIYHVIAVGSLTEKRLEITRPIEGRAARTRVEVVDTNREATHLKAAIDTGRTHQIRKHLALIRHPVAGDRAYLTDPLHSGRLRRVPRQMLHASSLAFTHPATRQSVIVRAPLPADFVACLRQLGLR